jgi:hypothetical protein
MNPTEMQTDFLSLKKGSSFRRSFHYLRRLSVKSPELITFVAYDDTSI